MAKKNKKKYSHGGPHDSNLAKVKKGLRYVESSDGAQMINPKSSATGLYGQLYGAEELQYMPYLQGIDRQSFASDTTLQNKLFEDRYYGNIPKVPGLKGNAEDLRIEYKSQLAEKGIPFNYTDDEISALSNLLGRQGTREYFGYVLRDGKSLADVFPKIYGPDAEAPNKTPEKYLESYRIGRDLKYGGQIRNYQNGGPTDPPTNPPNPYDITQTDLTSFESVNQNQLRYMNSPVYLDRLRAEGVTNPEEIRDSRINNINNTIIQTNPNDITGATPVPFNNKGQYGVNFGKDLQDVKELYPGTTARSVYSHELSHIAGGNNNPDAIAPLSEGATRQLQSTNINWQNAPWQNAEGYKNAGYGYDPFYNMTDQRKLNSWKNKYPDMGLPPGTDYWDENTNSFVKLSPGGTSKIYGRPEMKSGRFNRETGSYDEDTYYVPEGYPKKEAQKYLDYLTEVEQLPKDEKAYVNNLRYKGGDPNNKETKWWKKNIGKGQGGNIHDMRWFTKADGTNVMDDVEWKTIKDRGSNLFLRGEEYGSPPMSQEKWADNLPLEGAKTGRYKVLTDSHYGSAGEAKADLDGIRDFRETNYNFKREEETTPENWKQFIKDYKKSGVKDITIERTLEQYSEEDIIKNLNTIAMEQQGDFSTIAKYGGNMKKYKKGGPGSKMLPEVTVTPQMEALRNQGFDISDFPIISMAGFPKPEPYAGIAPTPSGSYKDLLQMVKNVPKFLNFLSKGPKGGLARISNDLKNLDILGISKLDKTQPETATKLAAAVDDAAAMFTKGKQNMLAAEADIIKNIKSGKDIQLPGRGGYRFSNFSQSPLGQKMDIQDNIRNAKEVFDIALKRGKGAQKAGKYLDVLKESEKEADFAMRMYDPASRRFESAARGELTNPSLIRFGYNLPQSPGTTAIENMYKFPQLQNKYGGKNMKEYGGKSMDVDYEAEGGEVVIGNIAVNKAYNGGIARQYKGSNMFKLEGPSHADGGIGITMQTGGKAGMNYMRMGGDNETSYVFSDAIGKKGNTFADRASKFGNKLDNINTMAMGGEISDRNTAERMGPRVMSEVKDLFNEQEEYKVKNNIDQDPDRMILGGLAAKFGATALGQLGASAGLGPGLTAAQFLPGAINVATGLFGKAPELNLERVVPEMQEYEDFTGLQDTYMNQQDRSLYGLRKGLEGSGATGSQIRGNLQAGLSGAQNSAGQFFSQLGQMQNQSNRQTDNLNYQREVQADQMNSQMDAMEAQFAAQNDPTQAFSQGLSQLIGTGTGMAKEGFNRKLMEQLFGNMGGNNSPTNNSPTSNSPTFTPDSQYMGGSPGLGLDTSLFGRFGGRMSRSKRLK